MVAGSDCSGRPCKSQPWVCLLSHVPATITSFSLCSALYALNGTSLAYISSLTLGYRTSAGFTRG